MADNVVVFLGDVGELGCVVQSFHQQMLGDGWIKVTLVDGDERLLVFVRYFFGPVYCV